MKNLKKIMLIIISLFMLPFAACSKEVPVTVIDISPDDALALLEKDSKAMLIDVRTPEEYQASRIPGSTLVADYNLVNEIESVVPDKNTPVILHCRSGRRSAASAKLLVKLGYTDVYDLGGIIDWPYDTKSGI